MPQVSDITLLFVQLPLQITRFYGETHFYDATHITFLEKKAAAAELLNHGNSLKSRKFVILPLKITDFWEKERNITVFGQNKAFLGRFHAILGEFKLKRSNFKQITDETSKFKANASTSRDVKALFLFLIFLGSRYQDNVGPERTTYT